MTKTDLHRIVDELPEGLVDPAVRVLEALQDAADPVLQALLNAPLDDEPTTPEEDARAEEARRQYERGELISHEELKRRLGL